MSLMTEIDRQLMKEERWLASRPICSICDEPIQDESAVCIKGDWICDECLDSFREYIDL